MKIGIFTTPNAKGQIVIPKKIRNDLGITPQTHLNLVARDGVIYIYPVSDVVTLVKGESSYLKFLEKTQGTWARDDWRVKEKKRRKLELKANEKNKKAW